MNYGDERLPERFWSKVCVSNSGCWEWTANKSQGYGRFRLSTPRRVVSAHRHSYEQLVGAIPDGLDLDHLCRNRACCNPDHLEPVTRRVNLLRGQTLPADEVSRTHCPRGHEYVGDNVVIRVRSGRSMRVCRECTQIADRERYARDPKARYYYKPRARQAITHCKRGHEFTPENTISKPNGTKRCRTCTNTYQRERRRAIATQE